LELKIDSVSPNVVYPGLLVTVTVSLKNVGEHIVSIPWQDAPVTPAQLNPADETTSYEHASLDLRLATGQDRHDAPVYLKGDVSLEATPNDPGQHVQLAPNQWVTITYAATVACALKDHWACRPFEADDHAVLTAGWREWLSTRKDNGCSIVHGAFKARDLTSAPIDIIFISQKPPRAN
jgi:hypothetical protein